MSKKIILFGHCMAVGLIVLSLVVPNNVLWLALMIVSLVIGVTVSFMLPRKSKNTKLLFIGAALLIIGLIMSLDMYDEMINTYSGGFEVGNGFLLDGISGIVYIYLVPVLFCTGELLLILNSVKKLRSRTSRD